MKFRLGACAAVVLLAACSGQKPDSQMAALHGSAGGDSLKSQARAAMKPSGRDVHHSIASAPDRGTLMAYKNQGKPVKREGAFTYYPVAMSEDHALKGVVSGHMTVPMPDGSEVKLNYERHDEGIDGNWTWVGRVEGGDPMQEAIITFGEEAVFASIPQGRGKPPLNIRTQGGSLYAVQMDPSKVRSPNVGHNDMAVPEASTLREAVANQVLAAKAQVAQNAVAQAAAPTAANTIDVAIGYTAGFRNKAQLTHGSVTTALTYLLQIANQGLSNSEVNGYLRLVNAQEVSYTDSNTNQTALHELTGSNGTASVAIPTTLIPIRTARDQYGADVALLVRGFQQPEQQGCGIAWLIGANGANVDPVQDARWGYGVVSFGDDTGTDGNSYYCAPESMIHEVGHLLGSAHDRANSTTPGRFPYSYGYKSTAGNFYTIMAYGDQNQTPYRLFSNPNILTCGSTNPGPCGVANDADNARSLNQTIPVVAQFRQTVVPFGGERRHHDFDANGSSDVLWFNPSQSVVQFSLLNAGTYISSFASFGVPAGFTVKASGHFDEDAASDLLVVNETTRSLRFWLNRGSFFEGRDLGGYGAGWTVAAVGDLDADGISDIVFHNATTSTIQLSKVQAGAIVANRSYTIPTGYTVKAIANVDGAGRQDLILERPDTRDVIFWLAKDEVFEARSFARYGADWALAGLGDFNCDGTDDVIWDSETLQRIEFSYVRNAGISQTRAFARPAGLRVASVVMFSGDKCSDLIMNDTVNRNAVTWINSNSVFSGYTLGGYGIGWQLVK